MEYRNHRKNFIMLEEQDRGFALDKERPIRGYLKMETGGNRGSVRVGAENLKPFDRKHYIYKLILFGKRNERTIYKIMGDLVPSSRGKGETYLRMDPLDLDGKGNELSSFSIATVVAVSMADHREPLHPILRGRLEHKDRRGCRRQRRGGFNDFYNQHILSCCQAIEYKKELYDKTIPFREDRTGADWRRVVNLGKFPVISPGAQYMIARYRHFIFGSDETYYYVGVPGRYLENEQPDEGRSGFVLWQPIVGAESYHADKDDAPLSSRQVAYGYWIAAIHRESGRIEDIRRK